jgi:hypothetical protein
MLAALVLALSTAVGEPAEAGAPTAKQLAELVATRYRSLRTYHDRGTVRGEGFPPPGYSGEFETHFVRGEGFKLAWTNRWGVAGSVYAASGIVWGPEHCLTSYVEGTTTGTCAPADEQLRHVPVNTSPPGIQALLVPSYLLPGVQWPVPFRTLPAIERVAVHSRRVAAERWPDGHRLHVLIDEGSGVRTRYTQRQWIDAASLHIVRYELTSTYQPGRARVETIDYTLVELDQPVAASVVQQGPSFLELHTFDLVVATVSAVGLLLSGAMACGFGRAYGRGHAVSTRGTLLRVLGWPAVLAWSVVPVVGDGATVLPLPAWMAILTGGLEGALLGAPPPALSLFFTAIAAWLGVQWGRRERARARATQERV